MTKTFTPTSVDAGTGGHTFTIDVKNTGVSQADNLNLTDAVDRRLIVWFITAGAYDCTASSGQSIDCDLANLDAGATQSITVTYSVAASTAAASVDNTRLGHGR